MPTSASTLPNAAALLAVASTSPPKPACIRQPALFSGSVIDLSTQEAGQAAASASQPVCIGQPVHSSGSVIDLTNLDAAAVASTSPAKAIRQPAPVVDLLAPDIARIDAVEDSRVLAKQNLALAIVVKQQKSQEQEAAHMFTLMEASSNQLREDIVFLGNTVAQKNAGNQTYCNRIHKLENQLANNQADLVWNLRENITLLEQSAEETGWDHFPEISQLEWRHSSEISQL